MDEIVDIDAIIRVGTWYGETYYLAVFPGCAGDMCPSTCTILDENEGHQTASMAWWQKETRAPYPSEYTGTKQFLAQLAAMGYRIRRMRKATAKHYRERLAEVTR